jgi:hypothetical protein
MHPSQQHLLVGAILAIISQMAATSGKTATEVISDLKDAIKNNTLSGTLPLQAIVTSPAGMFITPTKLT